MRSRAASQSPSSDAEIFFTSVFAVAAVLVTGELLFRLLIHSGDGPLGPSLHARTAPLSSVRPLYAFFVLLPSVLAFLAIGLPFFLRTVSAALRGNLHGRVLPALLAIGACLAAAAIEVRIGRTGVVSVFAAAAVAGHQSRHPIACLGDRHGFTLVAAAGAWLAGLAWYEWQAIASAEASVAIAPTMLVASLFFAAAGLLTTTAAALEPRAQGRVVVALAWLAVLAWLGAPLLRARLADTAAAADRIELGCTGAAAVVLLVSGLAQRLRG